MIWDQLLLPALTSAIESCGYSLPERTHPCLAPMPKSSHYELSCAVAFPLAFATEQTPFRMAQELVAQLRHQSAWRQYVEDVDISNGFLNLVLTPEAHTLALAALVEAVAKLPRPAASGEDQAGDNRVRIGDMAGKAADAAAELRQTAARLNTLYCSALQERADVLNATMLPPVPQPEESGFSFNELEGNVNRKTLLRLCEFIQYYPQAQAVKAHAHRFQKEAYALCNDLRKISHSSSFVDSTGGITKSRLQLACCSSRVLLYAAHCLQLVELKD